MRGRFLALFGVFLNLLTELFKVLAKAMRRFAGRQCHTKTDHQGYSQKPL